jgi:hypothetical protein
VPKTKPCQVCKTVIPADLHIIARSRTPVADRDPDGLDADYCGETCRKTAAKRRERTGTAIPRKTYLKKARKKN